MLFFTFPGVSNSIFIVCIFHLLVTVFAIFQLYHNHCCIRGCCYVPCSAEKTLWPSISFPIVFPLLSPQGGFLSNPSLRSKLNLGYNSPGDERRETPSSPVSGGIGVVSMFALMVSVSFFVVSFTVWPMSLALTFKVTVFGYCTDYKGHCCMESALDMVNISRYHFHICPFIWITLVTLFSWTQAVMLAWLPSFRWKAEWGFRFIGYRSRIIIYKHCIGKSRWW